MPVFLLYEKKRKNRTQYFPKIKDVKWSILDDFGHFGEQNQEFLDVNSMVFAKPIKLSVLFFFSRKNPRFFPKNAQCYFFAELALFSFSDGFPVGLM